MFAVKTPLLMPLPLTLVLPPLMLVLPLLKEELLSRHVNHQILLASMLFNKQK